MSTSPRGRHIRPDQASEQCTYFPDTPCRDRRHVYLARLVRRGGRGGFPRACRYGACNSREKCLSARWTSSPPPSTVRSFFGFLRFFLQARTSEDFLKSPAALGLAMAAISKRDSELWIPFLKSFDRRKSKERFKSPVSFGILGAPKM